ncbi:wall-associated receptor kinase-like 1 [Vitis vinifera]|uniref:wall-associated receptor kinase-like 1 n=1 Tax=Vitis vinifera TaxID=29760 RepID=UPI0008FFDCDC|nr:wall-associated receptor kinase-like 1 [Vitis vinifera]|eukprot:XP_019073866.1 PREDICTED: wall-associated receptor kinase-like 1 [Vitis vinifera]
MRYLEHILFLRTLYLAAYESQFNKQPKRAYWRRMSTVRWLLQISLLLWLSRGLAATQGKSGCLETCGDVDIPYPFGIGSAGCYFDEWFEVTCNNSIHPHIPKPFLKILNLEVLNVSLNRSTIRVNNPVLGYMNCSGKPSNDAQSWEGGPFSFSDTYTRFTAVGCSTLAYITQNDSVIGGCMSYCKQGTTAAKNGSCYGLKCCQTQFPPGLQYFTTMLGDFPSNSDDQDECKYAFMVDQEWFISMEQDPDKVKDVGHAPAVLDWRIYNATCKSVGWNNTSTSNTSTSFCGANAICSADTQTPSLTCRCPRGYEGNPYLTEGCEGTNYKLYENGTVCINRNANFSCYPVDKLIVDPRPRRMVLPGILAGVGTLLLVICAWWLYKVLKRRQKIKYKEKCFKRNGGLLLEQQLSSSEGNVDKTKLFTSKELEKATDRYNENRVIGQGGQGTVYKGMLMDGRIVAVKKLKIVGDGKVEQFINEVVILSQINHRNVVKLLGCCLETAVPLLVYEFIPNGTLSEHIHDQNEEFPITWEMRLRIAIEVAGALSYLHSAASIPIYHRDIKSTNILLDDKYRAKVADFGTSKSVAIDQTHLTTQVQGTFGYLDPEYFQSSQFTEKSDVYSFGIVLIELLTGKKPILSTASEEGKSLASYFILSMNEDRLSDLLDAQVVKEGKKEEINAIAFLARRCINLNGKKRPTMMEVAMELERIRKCQGDFNAQENFEEVGYDTIELTGPWDVASTSMGSCLNTNASSSSDVQPLLFQKSF